MAIYHLKITLEYDGAAFHGWQVQPDLRTVQGELEKAFSLVPKDPTVSEHLGDVYFKTKSYQKSLDMYERALSLKHPHPDNIKEKIERVKKYIK